MHYPGATPGQAGFFRDHGHLAVGGVIPQADLDQLDGHCDTLIRDKERPANDWAWDAEESRGQRSFRIVQSFPALVSGRTSANRPIGAGWSRSPRN